LGQRACPHAQLGVPETGSRADSGTPPAASSTHSHWRGVLTVRRARPGDCCSSGMSSISSSSSGSAAAVSSIRIWLSVRLAT
jgi:hypothetical protein